MTFRLHINIGGYGYGGYGYGGGYYRQPIYAGYSGYNPGYNAGYNGYYGNRPGLIGGVANGVGEIAQGVGSIVAAPFNLIGGVFGGHPRSPQEEAYRYQQKVEHEGEKIYRHDLHEGATPDEARADAIAYEQNLIRRNPYQNGGQQGGPGANGSYIPPEQAVGEIGKLANFAFKEHALPKDAQYDPQRNGYAQLWSDELATLPKQSDGQIKIGYDNQTDIHFTGPDGAPHTLPWGLYTPEKLKATLVTAMGAPDQGPAGQRDTNSQQPGSDTGHSAPAGAPQTIADGDPKLAQAQEILEGLGLSTGTGNHGKIGADGKLKSGQSLDGKNGQETHAAIAAFAEEANKLGHTPKLPADGNLTPEILTAMQDSTLMAKMQTPDAKADLLKLKTAARARENADHSVKLLEGEVASSTASPQTDAASNQQNTTDPIVGSSAERTAFLQKADAALGLPATGTEDAQIAAIKQYGKTAGLDIDPASPLKLSELQSLDAALKGPAPKQLGLDVSQVIPATDALIAKTQAAQTAPQVPTAQGPAAADNGAQGAGQATTEQRQAYAEALHNYGAAESPLAKAIKTQFAGQPQLEQAAVKYYILDGNPNLPLPPELVNWAKTSAANGTALANFNQMTATVTAANQKVNDAGEAAHFSQDTIDNNLNRIDAVLGKSGAELAAAPKIAHDRQALFATLGFGQSGPGQDTQMEKIAAQHGVRTNNNGTVEIKELSALAVNVSMDSRSTADQRQAANVVLGDIPAPNFAVAGSPEPQGRGNG